MLAAAGVVNRLLGFVPRIALPRMIGADGVGLYQMGYPLLIVLLTVITGGIPLSVAKLVAEADSRGDERSIRKTLSAALAATLGAGLLLAGGFLAVSDLLVGTLFTDERVSAAFRCMAPILPIVAVSAVLRGYFQGRQNMIPPASSQIVETVVRIVAVLALSAWLMRYGVEYAAAGAMLGVAAGELAGMLMLVGAWRRSTSPLRDGTSVAPAGKSESDATVRSVLGKLLKIAAPVTGSRLVGSASYFLESVLIVQSLAAAGVAASVATAQYGMLQGMVIPVLLLPTALTYSLSVSLVPALSEAAARNDRDAVRRRLSQSIRLSLVAGAPFVTAMFVLSEPLCRLLYRNGETGRMLGMMAPFALMLYVQGPLQAALQALDRPGAALRNTVVGAVVKLVLIVVLASRPEWGIYGAVVAINVNMVLVTILHAASVVRLLGIRVGLVGDLAKTAACMTFMAAAVVLTARLTAFAEPSVRFAAACSAGFAVYTFSAAWLGLIDPRGMLRVILRR